MKREQLTSILKALMKNQTENHLHINDLFWTVQGEGFHSGRRALFVRLPYCSLACSWCDTDFSHYKKWLEEDFLKFAKKESSRFAVLTGGEPSIHIHTPRLISLLKSLGFEIAMESNGCHLPPEGVDFLTVSPKRDSERLKKEPFFIHEEAWKRAGEFKYVVDQGFDFSILEKHNQQTNRYYYLSPEYSELKNNSQKILQYIEKNPKWRLSLQTHKWIDIP